MFDYSLVHWSSFFIAATLLNLAPGPDMAYILAHTAKGVKSSGFAAMFGVWSGSFVHAIFAALGISAILMTSALAFSMVKWVGALYLLWLGIQSLRSNSVFNTRELPTKLLSTTQIFKQGILVSILNPKVAIFFLAFLPQFVEPNAGPPWAQLLLHAFLILLIAAFIEPPLILLGDKLSVYIQSNPRTSIWMDRSLGGILIGLGLKLATTEQHS